MQPRSMAEAAQLGRGLDTHTLSLQGGESHKRMAHRQTVEWKSRERGDRAASDLRAVQS